MLKDITKSSVLHALLLLAFIYMPFGGSGEEEGEKGKSKKPEYTEVDILPPPVEEEAVTAEGDLEALKKIAPHAGDKCASFFGGIGIQESSFAIVTVYPGYPADRAGILPGDEVLSTNEIRGEVGTPVTVVVIRNGVRIEFHLIRDKICTG